MKPFSVRVLTWFDRHGRKDLPWQHDVTAYRVWVSEIMLQQTRVETVRDYYLRFMARFPEVAHLARAPEDEVLALWSGLGYYARGRNLHAAAQRIMDEHGGEFPDTLAGVMALPGIGRSTAGAILALSAGQRHAILDGNVKRVLARHRAIDGWPGRRSVDTQLWQAAEAALPRRRLADYTQAMMDLGATVCTPRDPGCMFCPVAGDCRALARGNPGDYPTRKPRKPLPVRSAMFLMARRGDGAILLQRRPPSGIWGGLWCFPECDNEAALSIAMTDLGVSPGTRTDLAPLRHTFSHFHLDIQPVLLDVEHNGTAVRDDDGTWVTPEQHQEVGLAAVVVRLLQIVENTPRESR